MHNSSECWRCHDPCDPVRGALQLALKPNAIRPGTPTAVNQQVAGLLSDCIAIDFRNIMISEGDEFMDTLMRASSNIPGVKHVRVYSRLGDLAFGEEEGDDVNTDQIYELLELKRTDKQFHKRKNTLKLFVPLAHEGRCQVCHGSKFPMRGAIVVDFYADSLRQFGSDVYQKLTPVFQSALLEGFRGIMLVGRANSVRYYLDDIRTLPVIPSVSVFDKDGYERFLNPKPHLREESKVVVESLKPLEFVSVLGGDEELVRLSPPSKRAAVLFLQRAESESQSRH